MLNDPIVFALCVTGLMVKVIKVICYKCNFVFIANIAENYLLHVKRALICQILTGTDRCYRANIGR